MGLSVLESHFPLENWQKRERGFLQTKKKLYFEILLENPLNGAVSDACLTSLKLINFRAVSLGRRCAACLLLEKYLYLRFCLTDIVHSRVSQKFSLRLSIIHLYFFV